jgi:hypothetical protein
MRGGVVKEKYRITLKGLISGVVDDRTLTRIMDEIELYMRRHDFNAIVFHDGEFTFEKVQRG